MAWISASMSTENKKGKGEDNNNKKKEHLKWGGI